MHGNWFVDDIIFLSDGADAFKRGLDLGYQSGYQKRSKDVCFFMLLPYLSICLSVYLSIYLPTYLPIYIYLYMYIFIHESIIFLKK